MNAATRRSAIPTSHQGQEGFRSKEDPGLVRPDFVKRSRAVNPLPGRARVYIAAGSRLLREAFARMLSRRQEIELVGLDAPEPFPATGVNEVGAHVLLLASTGRVEEDIQRIRHVRLTAPTVRVVLMGMTDEENEFLRLVRAGISAYLPLDAPADELVRGIEAVLAGEAVCPGALCAGLFRFHERAAEALPWDMIHQALGLTRREQQLVPLIAQGLTNKEIADRFSLSEQTVKNHLYRMKHKTGADDRFGIVDICRRQGLPV